jgi:hypothetical protein
MIYLHTLAPVFIVGALGQGIAENTGRIVGNIIVNNTVDECGGAHNGQIQVRGTDVLVQGNRVSHSRVGHAGDSRSFAVLGSGTALVVDNVFLAHDDKSSVNDAGTGTYRNNVGYYD